MTETTTPKEQIEAAIKDLGLTFEFEFVPFNMSRNKDNKSPSLNWIVTLKRGNSSMSFDYSAGCGHCPGSLKKQRDISNHEAKQMVNKECETGFACIYLVTSGNIYFRTPRRPILPDTADIISSIVLDASVLDSGSFEEWASEFGYDTDSRSAEVTYNASLQQALQLRRLVGDSGLRTLQEASQDY